MTNDTHVLGTHQPVLLDEVMAQLAIKADGIYVDLTFGRGGHSAEILRRLGPSGQLFAIDRDPAAVAAGKVGLFRNARFTIRHGLFTELLTWMNELALQGKVNGVLLDLGLSSPQLDDAERGFSFTQAGPLDMRMNPSQGISATVWLNQSTEQEMVRALREYGEERYARRIAATIVKAREKQPITTTQQLAELVLHSVPFYERGKHPATRSFQAIRMVVNNELEELQNCLVQCVAVLAKGGRISVISFHSLEDRVVKHFFRAQEKGEWPSPVSRSIPADQLPHQPRPCLKRIGSLIRPSEQEVRRNVRARSARLRTAEKCRD